MKTHVVIIEDNPALLAAVAEVLKDAGYRVTALNAIESLESLTELQADCFILDEHLPVVSGHIRACLNIFLWDVDKLVKRV